MACPAVLPCAWAAPPMQRPAASRSLSPMPRLGGLPLGPELVPLLDVSLLPLPTLGSGAPAADGSCKNAGCDVRVRKALSPQPRPLQAGLSAMPGVANLLPSAVTQVVGPQPALPMPPVKAFAQASPPPAAPIAGLRSLPPATPMATVPSKTVASMALAAPSPAPPTLLQALPASAQDDWSPFRQEVERVLKDAAETDARRGICHLCGSPETGDLLAEGREAANRRLGAALDRVWGQAASYSLQSEQLLEEMRRMVEEEERMRALLEYFRTSYPSMVEARVQAMYSDSMARVQDLEAELDIRRSLVPSPLSRSQPSQQQRGLMKAAPSAVPVPVEAVVPQSSLRTVAGETAAAADSFARGGMLDEEERWWAMDLPGLGPAGTCLDEATVVEQLTSPALAHNAPVRFAGSYCGDAPIGELSPPRPPPVPCAFPAQMVDSPAGRQNSDMEANTLLAAAALTMEQPAPPTSLPSTARGSSPWASARPAGAIDTSPPYVVPHGLSSFCQADIAPRGATAALVSGTVSCSASASALDDPTSASASASAAASASALVASCGATTEGGYALALVCDACGSTFAEDSIFCRRCGAKRPVLQAPMASAAAAASLGARGSQPDGRGESPSELVGRIRTALQHMVGPEAATRLDAASTTTWYPVPQPVDAAGDATTQELPGSLPEVLGTQKQQERAPATASKLPVKRAAAAKSRGRSSSPVPAETAQEPQPQQQQQQRPKAAAKARLGAAAAAPLVSSLRMAGRSGAREPAAAQGRVAAGVRGTAANASDRNAGPRASAGIASLLVSTR